MCKPGSNAVAARGASPRSSLADHTRIGLQLFASSIQPACNRSTSFPRLGVRHGMPCDHIPWLTTRGFIQKYGSPTAARTRFLQRHRPRYSRRSLNSQTNAPRRVTHAELLGSDGSGPLKDLPLEVKVQGLVRSIRKQKRVAFAHIQDGTVYNPIQAILNPELAADLTNGAYVQLTGRWEESPGAGQSHELHVTAVEDVGLSNAEDNPIQKQSMPPDYLRTIPHMRIRTPFQSILARTRSQLIRSAGDFFENRQKQPAVQLHPPLITSSDCEGAGEVFTLAPQSYSPLPESNGGEVSPDKSKLFFRDPKYLTVSSQLHLEAYAAEHGSVWALSPTFRAEESDTTRHLAEFYMLEAEYRGLDSLFELTSHAKALIQHLAQSLQSHCTGTELIAMYADRKHRPAEQDPPDLEDRWSRLCRSDWPEITYSDAILELQTEFDKRPFSSRPTWQSGFSLEHERWIVENLGQGLPTIVTHYPKIQKPFYMLPTSAATDRVSQEHPAQNDETVACFDILLPHGYAEVCGGSLREHRLSHLIEAMRDKNLLKQQSGKAEEGEEALYPHLQPGESLGNLRWYADLRRFGSSPHGGFGLGFDRLLAYLTGAVSVRDVVGFPRYWGRADC